jgi:hypothetical protein
VIGEELQGYMRDNGCSESKERDMIPVNSNTLYRIRSGLAFEICGEDFYFIAFLDKASSKLVREYFYSSRERIKSR